MDLKNVQSRAQPLSSAQPVRLRRRGRPAPCRPRVQVRPAIPHSVAEAVKGGSVPAHPVAVQRSVREAEIVRRAPGVEESALVVAHAARPFDCRTLPVLPRRRPLPDHSRSCRETSLPLAVTRSDATKVSPVAEAFKADSEGKSCIGPPFGPMCTLPRDGAVTGPHCIPGPKYCTSGRKPAGAILSGHRDTAATAFPMPSLRIRAARSPAGGERQANHRTQTSSVGQNPELRRPRPGHPVTEQKPLAGSVASCGRMRRFRNARFRIRIALWMLTELESIQQRSSKSLYITVG